MTAKWGSARWCVYQKGGRALLLGRTERGKRVRKKPLRLHLPPLTHIHQNGSCHNQNREKILTQVDSIPVQPGRGAGVVAFGVGRRF
ncbi:hypothetical protein MTR_1g069760 [Medicago truncatula]|uniref:Uncharacterized protein n=1 Tax=Medicago truncatula TaxID=3880 RepID=A0A072VWN8_MEDTR|nr:hypothetical protein MTR_1g069760 [Medicago truncatula]